MVSPVSIAVPSSETSPSIAAVMVAESRVSPCTTSATELNSTRAI